MSFRVTTLLEEADILDLQSKKQEGFPITENEIILPEGKAHHIVLTEEEKAKCREISKKIMEEDQRLGAQPSRGSKDPEILLAANYRGICAELAVSRLYPGSIPENFRIDFSKPHPIGGPDIILPNGQSIQVKSTQVYSAKEIIVDPCKVGPERKWRFCDYTYVVYYRDRDLQIVTFVPLSELKESPKVGFGRLLRLPYEKFWKGRIDK
ncbi:MAG TPA: hypothetical protein VGS11_07715 [Candidatus Bathyarchaeia archaeon]|nr:hypothetical protein [Candidatus Bathyarchaeia archaeon]